MLHLTGLGIFLWLLIQLTGQQMTADAQSRMSSVATLLASQLDHLPAGLRDANLPTLLKRLGQQTRVRLTIIDDDGVVIADSETGTRDIGLHDTREEILSAKETGVGFSQRYSATMDQRMMYFAQAYTPADDQSVGGIVRVAIPEAQMKQAIGSWQRTMGWFAGLMSLLTAGLMALLSARAMEPLNDFSVAARNFGEGQYERMSLLKHRRDEWGELANAFELMQHEITRREDRLIENSERLEAVLSSMIEGVVGLDPQGTVMLANEAACRMLALSLEDLHGRKLLDIVRIPELNTAVAQTQLHRKFSKTEFLTLSEPKRRLSARVSVLANNVRPGIAIVLHDVTELRQLETMRQDFVANVSHELKTPLSSIKAYAETLKMGALYDQDKNLRFIERIESQAELLERQIQDLLELARVESGKAAFRIARVSLNQVCELEFQQLGPLAEKHRVQLKLELTDANPLVQADQEAIKTIVQNLLLNAIHYTPAGGSVTLATTIEQDLAIIKVIDTGIGIAPDQQLRIFERFYRVDRARSRDKGGTGLGLSIVKHLTQAFNGSVTLESAVGKGSKFSVRFPRTTR